MFISHPGWHWKFYIAKGPREPRARKEETGQERCNGCGDTWIHCIGFVSLFLSFLKCLSLRKPKGKPRPKKWIVDRLDFLMLSISIFEFSFASFNSLAIQAALDVRGIGSADVRYMFQWKKFVQWEWNSKWIFGWRFFRVIGLKLNGSYCIYCRGCSSQSYCTKGVWELLECK